MPSRKQRRRREKLKRHEYELVYLDEEGNEVEVDPAELKPEKKEREKARNGKPAARGASGRAAREVQPPAWNRVWKRAGFFTIFMFIVLSILNSKLALGGRLLLTLMYGALFVPFIYLMDRVQYRSYLKRTGKTDPRAAKRR